MLEATLGLPILTVAGQLHTSTDDLLNRFLYPLEVPTSWRQILQDTGDLSDAQVPIYVCCGPKSAGKSTFARMLANRLLTSDDEQPFLGVDKIDDNSKTVYWLDADPGQPEFGPSGQLSLVELRQPILGPPFTHQCRFSSPKYRLCRAHNIAATSPKDCAGYMTSCLLDLVKHFTMRSKSASIAPLIVNCSGWITSTGLRMLTKLLVELWDLGPIHVIHMGEAPIVIRNIANQPNNRFGSMIVHQASAQPHAVSSRSSAELRAMQMLSYFHQLDFESGVPEWYEMPLTHQPPWLVSYGTHGPGILGILQAIDPQPPKMLSTVLNGAVVALVRINEYVSRPSPSANQVNGENGEIMDIDAEVEHEGSSHGKDASRFQDEANISGLDISITFPQVLRTVEENLPYIEFDEAMADGLLDPSRSETLGVALVRDIDVANQCLHLLTPVGKQHLLESAPEDSRHPPRIVLVLGSLDNPGWAYQEDLHLAAHRENRRKRGDDAQDFSEGKTLFTLEEIPWVKQIDAREGVNQQEMRRRYRRF
jgi:polynucleotide 5'-hydroxyl-kinase GRC3/NOL9